MSVIQSKYAKTKKYDVPLYSEPQSPQECFSVKGIDDTGIFVLNDNKYSKCFVLSDINFAGMTDEEQKMIIIKFSRVINTVSTRFSYVIANEYADDNSYQNAISYPLYGDEKDLLRNAFNEVINDKVTDAKQGLYQTIYFTVTIESKGIKEARSTFSSMEASLRNAFIRIGVNGMAGSQLRPMDINTRMQKWYNLTHLGLRSKFKFDYYKMLQQNKDWINYVSPEKIVFYNDYFVMNDCIYGKVVYVSKYPQSLVSDFISEISKINCTSFVAVNNEPIELEVYKQEINRKHSSVGLQIERQKQRNRNNNDFLSDASEGLLDEREALVALARHTNEGDDHYFNSTILIAFLASSKKDMEDITSQIESAAGEKSYEVQPCFRMQREALNSCFIFGIQEFKRVCNFTSPCLAMFMPYKTQELNDERGLWYGINQLSQNSIIADQKKHGFHMMYLGKTRRGKSVFAKCKIIGTALTHPEEQIIIIDPQNEYRGLANTPGIEGSIISFDTQKEEYVNPLDVNFEGVDYSALQEIIAEKADFIFTLLSSCIKRNLDAEEQGILDQVIEEVYSENYALRKRLNGESSEITEFSIPTYMREKEDIFLGATDLSQEEQVKKYSPTLQDIYQKLLDMDNNKVAQKLAKHMHIFVNGSLNLFNHRTNVDLSNKFLVFDISGIKANLRTTAMLVMLEVVRNKLKENFLKGDWTNIFIDEFHELLRIPAVAEFVITLWKEAGKLKGLLGAITQNMSDMLNSSADSDKLATILSNTDCFAILCQSSLDRRKLEEFLPTISSAMYNFVEESEPGMGLLKMGPITVPFDMRMSKESALFQIVNTDGNNKDMAI